MSERRVGAGDAHQPQEIDEDMILGAPSSADAGRLGGDSAQDADIVLGGSSGAEPARTVPSHVPRAALDDEAATAGVARTRTGRLRRKVARFARVGARRVRRATPSVLATTLTCGLAYWIAQDLLGQPYPIVGPVLAWVALGIQRDRPPRRVAELALGATLGVLLGEAYVGLVGHGPLQFMAGILIAAMVGRFLDRAELFANQIVIQVMFMVTMPAEFVVGGATGRWAEALVGAGLAILASTFVRRDVGRRARFLGSSVLAELARVLDQVAASLRQGDPRRAAAALEDARGTQGIIEDWMDAARTAKEIVAINPALRGKRGDLAEEVNAATQADRALRNVRVIARLTVGAVEEDGANALVAGHVQRLATATRLLSHAHRDGTDPAAARQVLESVSAELSPAGHRIPGWRSQMVESLLRSLAVDLLQVAGASHSEAERHLPPR